MRSSYLPSAWPTIDHPQSLRLTVGPWNKWHKRSCDSRIVISLPLWTKGQHEYPTASAPNKLQCWYVHGLREERVPDRGGHHSCDLVTHCLKTIKSSVRQGASIGELHTNRCFRGGPFATAHSKWLSSIRDPVIRVSCNLKQGYLNISGVSSVCRSRLILGLCTRHPPQRCRFRRKSR